MALLICIAGGIGSGKSSVRRAIAEQLGWQCTGFGDYLRHIICVENGDPNSREALQNLGQKMVETDPQKFCEDVLAFGRFTPGNDFVIDGVRHVAIYNVLQRLGQPSVARLLFLNATKFDRCARIAGRQDSADFSRADANRVEAQDREALRSSADGIVDASVSLNNGVVASCLQLIRKWQKQVSY